VDVAIEQLNKGEWVHVFPEGNHNNSNKNQDSLVKETKKETNKQRRINKQFCMPNYMVV